MGSMREFQALKNVPPLPDSSVYHAWIELCNSCMARCALFLIQPFITEKYTFGLATGYPCFLCALSDVAYRLLYVPLGDMRWPSVCFSPSVCWLKHATHPCCFSPAKPVQEIPDSVFSPNIVTQKLQYWFLALPFVAYWTTAKQEVAVLLSETALWEESRGIWSYLWMVLCDSVSVMSH